MKLSLNAKEYTYLIGYQKDKNYRDGFNTLAKKIFNISFENWYEAGYWNEKYVPYTLFDGENAIANLSVNIMDFNTFGEQKRYIQIGTVMTDEKYRNKNLSKFLMKTVLEEWRDKCTFIYLYANHSVLKFYPKFGFSIVKEYEYYKPVTKIIAAVEQLEKLNMDIQSNRDKLHDYAKNSKPFGKLSMRENADLVMFYCISFLKNNVYYIKALDAIVVATYNGKQLRLWDIFSNLDVELDKIENSLVNPQVDEIVLGFTPNDCNSFKVREISGDDVLFIQNDKTKLFDEHKVMFPLLSHA